MLLMDLLDTFRNHCVVDDREDHCKIIQDTYSFFDLGEPEFLLYTTVPAKLIDSRVSC